jgi:hypothetical protein
MRKKIGHALRLGIGQHAIALVETRRWNREAVLVAEQPLDGTHALPLALTGALTALWNEVQRDRWPLTVVLADELVRLWHVTPPADCSRMADLQASAALRFQQLYGEPAADWQVSAHWQLQRPFLAAAAPRALIGAVQQSSHAHALRIVEAAPQFIVLFNRWRAKLAPGDWFGVVQEGVLTLAACDTGGIAALRAVAVPAQAHAAWLGEHVAREALRLNLPAPQRLRLCGAVPAAWAAAPDCVPLDEARADWSPAAQLAGSGVGA